MNKKILLFICGLLLYPMWAQAAELYTLETIERVISADTFQLESGKKIRLIGADAPEVEVDRKVKEDAQRTGQSVEEIIRKGKEAKAWAIKRLEGKNIFLKYDKIYI